jgi:vacuolar-type H+-ATPase subunit H
MRDTLQQCEHEVERARAKLADDLALLRSPSTVSSFTDDLKQEALDTKDALVEQAKDAAQSKLSDWVDDLKAKAAANPAAALTIGAGLAWQLFRNPPIATALVGAGLYSLLRTNGTSRANGRSRDYFQEGRERLKEQVSEFASSAGEVASDVGDKLAAKSGELLEDTMQTVRDWSHDARDRVAAVGSAVEQQTTTLMSKAGRSVEGIVDQTAGVAASATETTRRAVEDTVSIGQRALGDTDTRNQILLGAAGLAVAAALGMALQKKLEEKV